MDSTGDARIQGNALGSGFRYQTWRSRRVRSRRAVAARADAR